MATRNSIVLSLLSFFITGLTLAQHTEEQRKYVISDTSAFRAFILRSDTIGGFGMQFHSVYTYSDIYLDTPDRWLFRNGYSLRFRRRMDHDTLVSYGLQLKSEMETAQAARMEVEDNELQVFGVPTEKRWVPLPEILNVLFAAIDSGNPDVSDPAYAKAVAQLREWIRFKADGIVAPFRQLSKEMEALGDDKSAVETLLPVAGGTELRLRSHIYIDPKHTSPALEQVAFYRQQEAALPQWFQEHPSVIWTMESSLDDAVFYALSGKNAGQSIRIFEYELENKYPLRTSGTPLMNMFESALQLTYGAESHLDSKYRTCVKAFGW